VSHDEIEQNNYNLNISRYIQSQGQDDAVSLEDAISRLRASFDRAIEAEDKLKSLLDKSVDRG
jgi:type I restriction-modification system DNA methylase subunit